MIRSAGAFHILSATLILLAQGFSSMAAVEEPSRPVPPTQIGNWKLVARDGQQVTSATIFDYMNGAGELYLAYQFRGLRVWRYEGAGIPITVEAYELGSPTEAFGVLTQDFDGEDVKIGQQSLYAAGLLRLWQGRWFFRVLAENETPESRRAVLDLGRALAAQVPAEGKRPKHLDLLPREGLTSESIHYFHTQICLNSIYFFAVENLLQLTDQTEAAMGDYRFDAQRGSLLIIGYPNAASATAARDTFRGKFLANLAMSPEPLQLARLESGEWIGLRLEPPYLIVSFRSQSRDLCERLLKAVHLTKRGEER